VISTFFLTLLSFYLLRFTHS